jgi:hypothetical protein
MRPSGEVTRDGNGIKLPNPWWLRVNASGLEVDDEQHQVAHQAAACEHLDAEKVRGRDGPPAGLEERFPRHRQTLSRYHRRIVSGVASDATSASRLRPSGLPASERSRRSASVNRRRRGPRRARSTRFSTRKKLARLTLSTTEPAGDQQNQDLKRRYARHDHRTLPTKASAANAIRPECRAIEFGTVRPRRARLRPPRPRP